MSLAAAARKYVSPTPDISIYHMEMKNASLDDLRNRLEKEKPDLVGFSALSSEAPGLYSCMSLTREVLPKSFIVVGGPHATIFHDHVLARPEVDAVAMGEGEMTFVELVDRIQTGKDWRDIDGIAYSKNGEKIYNRQREFAQNLDELPFPAYDLIDIPAYSRTHNLNGFLAAWPYMTIFTSRACPFGCIYCHGIFGKRFRARSPKNVIDEITLLYNRYGIRELHFLDDIFNWDIERSKEICREIIKSGLKIKIAFPNALRGDYLDDELIELMGKAGTYSIGFAVETTSERLIKIIRKNLNVNKVRENMQKALDVGIIPVAFYMIGFPSETESEIRATIDFAVNSPALKASFFSVVIYPRTGLYEYAKQVNPDFQFDDDKFEDLHYYSNVFHNVNENGMNIPKLIKSAYMRFYSRPWRIWKILLMYPKNRKFLKALIFALRLSAVGDFLDRTDVKIARIRSGLAAVPGPIKILKEIFAGKNKAAVKL